MRSFMALSAVDPGFDPNQVQTVKLSLVDSHYPYRDPDKIARFYRHLNQNIGELAGIEAVGATTELPLEGRAFHLAPYAYETPEGVVEWESVAAHYRTVTPGWFEAMKARLTTGRFFEWTDDLGHPNVVIIDDKLANLVWPGQDPIGQRLQVETFLNGEFDPVWAEVIGVVEHLRHHPGGVGNEQIYLPHQQSPMRTMTLAIRSTIDERTLVDAVKKEVRVLASFQPIQGVRAMTEYFDRSLAQTRFTLMTLALFAVMALALASVGIYGVIAFTVGRRTREIGIRMALGATPRKILESFLGESMMLTAAGLALGLVGAVVLTRTLSSLLYGVTATDPATFFAISLFLTAVATAAAYVPARRAAKVDPMTSLRQE
jgi:putative ABC transport system permease protein